MNPPETTLSVNRIQTLLAKVQTSGEASLTPVELTQYRRLMEVYCLVQLGGRQVQEATAQHFLEEKTRELEAEIAELAQLNPNHPKIALLRQEIMELQKSVSWRQQFLQAIAPVEEAAVRTTLALIEQTLVQRPVDPLRVDPLKTERTWEPEAP